MLLTLIAAVAQNESLNQSENVKWGIRRQYERGNVKSIPSGKFLGYTKDRQGNLVIDLGQADTVKRIYKLFMDGHGTFQIAMILTKEKVPMAYGGKEWCASHIYKALTNEKYMGDTLFQKTFNADYLTKYRVKNRGQLPQYYLKNSHPAIIDHNTWSLVQLEFARQKKYAEEHFMSKFHYNCERSPLSGKIVCSECGRVFGLRDTKRIVSDNIKYWQCTATLHTEKTCGNMQRLYEKIAEKAFVSAWNEMVSQKIECHSDDMLNAYRQFELKKLIDEHGSIVTMQYELMLKVLDHIEVHAGFVNVNFLAGNT